MIVTTLFTKRIISSLRCSFPVSTNNISCFANKLNIINSQRINHLVRQQQQQQQQQHRHLSSSSSSSTNTQRLSKRRQAKQKVSQQQQQQHDDDDENFKPIPRWPAVVSMLIVPVMFAAWGASDWFFGNKIKGINEGLRKEFIAAATITASHQKANNYNDNHNADDDDDYYLTVLEKKPTLFHCVIRRDTGFIHCLSGVQLLDVVEVLEEGVGPDRQYNLCRLPAKESSSSSGANEEESELESHPSLSISTDTYGWFPVRWLQKLDHYEFMVQEQARNIASSTTN